MERRTAILALMLAVVAATPAAPAAAQGVHLQPHRLAGAGAARTAA